uniref:Uncharacterized protein n=1 Tax=Junco hyemalis TaxID=40217 RepID=A0A8C5NKP2_JUNHY
HSCPLKGCTLPRGISLGAGWTPLAVADCDKQAQPSLSAHACTKTSVWPDRGLCPLSLGTDSSSRSPCSAVSLCGSPQCYDKRQKAPGTPDPRAPGCYSNLLSFIHAFISTE